MTAKVLLITALAACAYDAHYEDCSIRCSIDTGTGCPDDLTCKPEGLCRAPGSTETCATILSTFPSCVHLAESCGADATDDCCSSAETIPGGTFYRSYDLAPDGMYPSTNYPATVSPFVLDKYEVTVGRFRRFVEAGGGTRADPPALGAGGRFLNGVAGQGGWDTAWNANLVADSSTLREAVKCDASFQSWTDAESTNEELPINCVTWYEAFAFCTWDGGFLPTEAEWNYAAAGGAEQRAYPWSSPASSTDVDCAHANFNACGAIPRRVGSSSPEGDGRWQHADLAGNVWEWTLDGYQTPYTNPCDDCAELAGATRVTRGGSSRTDVANLRSAARFYAPAANRFDYGIRCARSQH